MPTYEYQCPKCDALRSMIHPMSENPALECIVCNTPMKRTFKIGGVSFVGGGWGSSDN